MCSTCGRAATAPDRVLLDPAASGAEDRVPPALDWKFLLTRATTDRLLAYGVSEGGSGGRSVLRVRDVDTGARPRGRVIPPIRAPARWTGGRTDPASSTRATRSRAPCPRARRIHHRRVRYEHVLGRDWREDPTRLRRRPPARGLAQRAPPPKAAGWPSACQRGQRRAPIVYLRGPRLRRCRLRDVGRIEGRGRRLQGSSCATTGSYLQTNLDDAPRGRLVACGPPIVRGQSPGADRAAGRAGSSSEASARSSGD